MSKGCCLLFSHQGLSAAQDCKNEEANLFAESFETGMRHVKAWIYRKEAERIWGRARRAKDEMKIIGSVKRANSISGGDALRGNTRSHPEHDG